MSRKHKIITANDDAMCDNLPPKSIETPDKKAQKENIPPSKAENEISPVSNQEPIKTSAESKIPVTTRKHFQDAKKKKAAPSENKMQKEEKKKLTYLSKQVYAMIKKERVTNGAEVIFLLKDVCVDNGKINYRSEEKENGKFPY